MGRDEKKGGGIDFGLLFIGLVLIGLGFSQGQLSTFLQYAPCLNGIPIAENLLSCSADDYRIGGLSVVQSWGWFVGVGIVLVAAAFVPPARRIVQVLFIIGLMLWVLGLFGVRVF